MENGQTAAAISAFEEARRLRGSAFTSDLELGVLGISLTPGGCSTRGSRLDRVPPSHPDYPMALFKRAQVSVLLNEPDKATHIARAREHANPMTRELIARSVCFGNP